MAKNNLIDQAFKSAQGLLQRPDPSFEPTTMVTQEDLSNLARNINPELAMKDIHYMLPPTQTEEDAAADALVSPELNRVPYQAEAIPLQGNVPPILEGTPRYNIENEYADNKYQAILNGTYTPTDEERQNPYLVTQFIDDYKGKLEGRKDILADLKNYAQNLMSSANYFNKKEMEDNNTTTPRIIRELEKVLPEDLQNQVKEFLYGTKSVNDTSNINNMLKDVAGKPNDTMNTYMDFLKKEEGFRAEPYKLPGEEFNTIGFGHYGSDVQDGLKITERQANNILRNDIEIRLEQITNAIPNFEGFKLNDRKHLLGSWFRGGLAGSPNTIALINEGKYKEAAKEFLDNDEYKNKKKIHTISRTNFKKYFLKKLFGLPNK